jgi:Protein of unknown function (DUF3035)
MSDSVTRTTGAARLAIALMGVALVGLGGCARGSLQNALGMGKQPPDEFAVTARAPLVIPPDFDLRPPQPGEPRPQVGTPSDQARASLLGQTAVPAATGLAAEMQPASQTESAGQQALLADAGSASANPQIRRQIAEENQSLAQVEQALFTRVMKWRQPSTLGATVDAPAEAERLRANRAKGVPPTTGDTPTVVERRQSPLGALVSKVF